MGISKRKIFILMMLIISLLNGCSEWRNQKTLGENIDDTNIVVNVKASLAADSCVISKNISVNSYKGTVQLSGFVSSATQFKRAAEITASVKGVHRVINNLVLLNP